MLKFRCPNCAQKLSTRDERAGRAARCPRCKERLTVPCRPAREPVLVLDDGLTLIKPTTPPDVAAQELAERQRLAEEIARAREEDEQLLASLGTVTPPPPEETGERRFPWLVDILLYPISTAGLTSLAIIVGLSFLLQLLSPILALGGMFGGVLVLGLYILMAIYITWYLAECIYDSATGGTRARDTYMGNVGLGDMWSRAWSLLCVLAVFVVPVLLYGIFVRRVDAILWALLAWAIVFYPIGVLAMVILDSMSALNPFLLIGAVCRTFTAYIGLLLLLVLVIILMALVEFVMLRYAPPLLRVLVARTLDIYAAMVLAHVLGRFYWRHSKRLDWGL
jgi:hypothetical protein